MYHLAREVSGARCNVPIDITNSLSQNGHGMYRPYIYKYMCMQYLAQAISAWEPLISVLVPTNALACPLSSWKRETSTNLVSTCYSASGINCSSLLLACHTTGAYERLQIEVLYYNFGTPLGECYQHQWCSQMKLVLGGPSTLYSQLRPWKTHENALTAINFHCNKLL